MNTLKWTQFLLVFALVAILSTYVWTREAKLLELGATLIAGWLGYMSRGLSTLPPSARPTRTAEEKPQDSG